MLLLPARHVEFGFGGRCPPYVETLEFLYINGRFEKAVRIERCGLKGEKGHFSAVINSSYAT
jgi:hypothetical protein